MGGVMRNILAILLISLVATVGCARLDPFSPDQRQEIENAEGRIEELKSNQNGVMAELLKLRQQTEVNARDIDRAQTGMLNRQNTGVQIFQGDGVLITIIVLVGIIMGSVLVISYYKSKSDKNQKTSEILAMQIAQYNDLELENSVFMAAMNTTVESDIYHLMVRNQSMLGRHG